MSVRQNEMDMMVRCVEGVGPLTQCGDSMIAVLFKFQFNLKHVLYMDGFCSSQAVAVCNFEMYLCSCEKVDERSTGTE